MDRRFLTRDDLRYDIYKNAKVGDEYNPIATVESVANLSIRTDLSKKFKKTVKVLDASYLVRVEPKLIMEHCNRLQDIIAKMWP